MKQTTKDGRAVEKGAVKRLRRKEYEKELARLQAELVRLQAWVVNDGLKVCVVFEGRDTAGKGGVIKRITERVSPSRLPCRREAIAQPLGVVTL